MRIKRSALIAVPVDRMFDLVSDVVAYPEFVPWCVGSRVLTATDHLMEAEIRVKRGMLTTTLRTRNRLQRPDRITLTQIQGPFASLEGAWEFTALSETACRAELIIKFRLKGVLKFGFRRATMEVAGDSVMKAFCERLLA